MGAPVNHSQYSPVNHSQYSLAIPPMCAVYHIMMIIMYIYHALINALSTHMIDINLNMMFYTHVEHSFTKTIYVKSNMEKQINKHTHTHMHAHMHACMHTHLSLIHI